MLVKYDYRSAGRYNTEIATQSGAPPVHSSARTSRWVLHNSSVQSLLLNIQHEQLTAGSDVMSEISELSVCMFRTVEEKILKWYSQYETHRKAIIRWYRRVKRQNNNNVFNLFVILFVLSHNFLSNVFFSSLNRFCCCYNTTLATNASFGIIKSFDNAKDAVKAARERQRRLICRTWLSYKSCLSGATLCCYLT